MDLATIIGGVTGTFFVIMTMVMVGGIHLYVSVSSFILVIGCTICTYILSVPIEKLLHVVGVLKNAFSPYKARFSEIIQTFVSFAEKARRDGLLALESDIEELDDEFLKKGLQLVVDGADPALIKSIMETELMMMETRHGSGIMYFRNMATLAPAFGMIGTLIGLIAMLAHMEDPEAIGPSMAVALITTMYGSIFANLYLIPIANKLTGRSRAEAGMREIMIEGMLAIQSGDNPRIVEDRLKAFLPPGVRKKEEGE
jgi:chemotaxis protein MotA